MGSVDATLFQVSIRDALGQIFGEESLCEWRTDFAKGGYSPRIDVAVGPFTVENGVSFADEYHELFWKNTEFFRRLVHDHVSNVSEILQIENQEAYEKAVREKMSILKEVNENARCFIAIEIENKSSRKHLLGGAVNAAALGRIGIAVGFNDKMHKCFLRLYLYFEQLAKFGKPTFNLANLLIVSKAQMEKILDLK